MKIDHTLTAADLGAAIDRLFALAAAKVLDIEQTYPKDRGTPVFTVRGRYTTRGWTEWTQGFTYGCALLVFDGTGERRFLDLGRRNTLDHMAPHLTHMGVHDHGFNNLSTYGNLLRLLVEGRFAAAAAERQLYELALKVSGAVQARRYARLAGGGGYVYSFNGPQSLFADTIRSMRALAVAHRLGHVLMGEQDEQVNLLGRLLEHCRATAAWNVYHGEGRDAFDVRGRVAHESVFNPNNGVYRCPNSQQGWSPFTTWTRGLAWCMLGFAEQLEFIATVEDEELAAHGGREDIVATLDRAAAATCDFYLANSAADGVCYWDTGAPDLHRLGDDYLDRPADPFNDFEPVDSSAAVIAAQALLRFGAWRGRDGAGKAYFQAGLTALRTLFAEPYLAVDEAHQGLILHSIYHRPNGWDHVPEGRRIPCGEASMWGDYHALEAAVYLRRLAAGGPPHSFFAGVHPPA